MTHGNEGPRFVSGGWNRLVQSKLCIVMSARTDYIRCLSAWSLLSYDMSTPEWVNCIEASHPTPQVIDSYGRHVKTQGQEGHLIFTW